MYRLRRCDVVLHTVMLLTFVRCDAMYSVCPSGQLRCAVGTLHWQSNFIFRKATSFYVRFTDNEVDSYLPNEVLALLVTMLCPADINTKKIDLHKQVCFFWLREKDLNQRPPGYEPDELPTALSRDIYFFKCSVIIYYTNEKVNTFFHFIKKISILNFLQLVIRPDEGGVEVFFTVVYKYILPRH